MVETVEYVHGDRTFEVAVVGDRYRCPVSGCQSQLETLDDHLRRHLGVLHGIPSTRTVECEHCGEAFEIEDSADQKYCSRSCFNDARRAEA